MIGQYFYKTVKNLKAMTLTKKIQEIFADEPDRLKHFTKSIDIGEEKLYFDYSKTHLTKTDCQKMHNKLGEKELWAKIKGMFEGENLNFVEKKPVLHVYLRDKDVLKKLKDQKAVDLKCKIKTEIYEELSKMKELSNKIRNKELMSATNKPIDTIVHIGIGGSELGPQFVCKALEYYSDRSVSVHFVTNVDATSTLNVFQKIDPEKTLFVVVSKSFKTPETAMNADLCLELYKKQCPSVDLKDVKKKQFAAITFNKDEASKFGCGFNLHMGTYVGGRFSLWSTVGLSTCCFLGFETFVRMLNGASEMDQHFLNSEKGANIPVKHACVEMFYNNFLEYTNKCVVAYDEHLKLLPRYVQQVEMESNGKTASSEVRPETCMLIWGETGTNCQHSFFQLLHQGTKKILTEFLVGLRPLGKKDKSILNHHNTLYANCIAQSEALMVGKKHEDVHKNFEGDRPSITIVYSKLTPEILGALIAMYEHKVFVQGIYWGINSFDQFGVELGKELANKHCDNIDHNKTDNCDQSTSQLIKMKIDSNKAFE